MRRLSGWLILALGAALAASACSATVTGTAQRSGPPPDSRPFPATSPPAAAPSLTSAPGSGTTGTTAQSPAPPPHRTATSAPGPAPGSEPGSAPDFPRVSPTADVPDGLVGLRPGAPAPDLAIRGVTDGRADRIAADSLADLFRYYTGIFPADFGQAYVPPQRLVSYDSAGHGETLCGIDTAGFANAFFIAACDLVAWDRGVMLPEMIHDIGVLAPAVVLSHEIGHDVQDQLGVPAATPTIVLEQQADCYAGAYWRWVADGHSRYFTFNQTEGMRQLLLSLFQGHDPAASASGGDDHGNGFDRTFAATLGYSEGAVRCSQIDADEVAARGQEFPFAGVPYQYGNVDITTRSLSRILKTTDDYFAAAFPGYVPPELATFAGNTPPACDGFAASFPVDYCPSSNTVSYRLAELQRIGTPSAGWKSANGDFSAIVLLVTRYALAALHGEHRSVTGRGAGLQALCYAGAWARWMRDPHDGYQLSPNDLDKAIYQIVSSPLAGSDANGRTEATILDRVEAFGVGVTDSLSDCTATYG